MILAKETKKKFGYSPGDVTKGSKRRVVVRCPFCKDLRDVTKSNFLVSSNMACRSCASKQCADKIAATLRARTLKVIEGCEEAEITPAVWLRLFRGHSITSTARKSEGNYAMLSNKSKHLSLKESWSFLKPLGARLEINSTEEFKSIMVKYLRNKPLSYRWAVANLIVSKSFYTISENQINVGIRSPLNDIVFDAVDGFVYRRVKNARAFTRATFYLNGQWRHFG